MNILDENIINSQREQLGGWRIAVRQIGYEIGRKGMKDDEIIPLLHQLNQPTFYTRDDDFYKRNLCHVGYVLYTLMCGKQKWPFLHAAYFVIASSLQKPNGWVKLSELHMSAWQSGNFMQNKKSI